MTALVLPIAFSPFIRGFGLSQALNLDAFLSEYKQGHVTQLSHSTQLKYFSHLRNHISPDLGDLTLSEISTRWLDQWLAVKKQDGLSWATRSDIRNILSSIYTVAKKWGLWTGENPVKLVNIGRRKAAREKRKLTVQQTRSLLAALPDDVRLVVMVALFCTLRISEILGLKWKHIDIEQGIIRVRQRYYRGDLDDAKTVGSERDVPIGELVDAFRVLYPLNDSRALEQYVFNIRTRRGWTRDDRSINQHFLRPAAKRLELYWLGFGFHAFRREAITGIAAEADPIQAMRAAGHTRMDTTLLYGLRDLERQDRAIRKMQASILPARKEKSA